MNELLTTVLFIALTSASAGLVLGLLVAHLIHITFKPTSHANKLPTRSKKR